MASATNWSAAALVDAIDTPLGSIRQPANWNGTLLLYSHGYAAADAPPELSPPGTVEWLLAHGYALAAARYSAPGWAVAEAVPDQIALREEFERRFGRPRHTIAWGRSMGGLVTIALAERHPDLIDAALPSCGSLAGSLGMMNEALDGAFAFKTLLAADTSVQIVHIEDDRANAGQAVQVAQESMQTPIGRARLALAAALAQVPLRQSAQDFAAGIFLPRRDQEVRAGGVYSWNTGIDYERQLAASGLTARVASFYREAHSSLAADLRTLNAAPRIAADAGAVAYMRLHYVPSGDLQIPTFSYHTINDPLTVPAQQQAYGSRVRAAGRSQNLRLGWVARVGHCRFTAGEDLAALHLVEQRLRDGRWDTSIRRLNGWSTAQSLGKAAFGGFLPEEFLRPCGPGRCPGEPASTPAPAAGAP